ncbi:MAG: DUF4878 domain-containing protein [Bacteroidales bacterium]|nr:DUF4878 domain-containing protein [Bacteroidales bacterium]
MKKLFFIVASALICTLFISSCNGSNEKAVEENLEPVETRSDVELAADAYYGLLANGNFKAAVQSTYDYNKEMTPEEEESMDAMLDMSADKIDEAMKEKEGIKEYVFSNEVVNGKNATIDVEITYGNGEKEVKTETLKKVEDTWYIK